MTVKHAVCLLYFNPDNASEILTVSRKNNYSSIGLVGGKVEDNEEVITALIREVKEEANIDINIEYLEPIYQAMDGEYLTHTYLYTSKLDVPANRYINNENSLVCFSSIKEITSSKTSQFYRYNLDLILSYLLDISSEDVGIDVLDIDPDYL